MTLRLVAVLLMVASVGGVVTALTHGGEDIRKVAIAAGRGAFIWVGAMLLLGDREIGRLFLAVPLAVGLATLMFGALVIAALPEEGGDKVLDYFNLTWGDGARISVMLTVAFVALVLKPARMVTGSSSRESHPPTWTRPAYIFLAALLVGLLLVSAARFGRGLMVLLGL